MLIIDSGPRIFSCSGDGVQHKKKHSINPANFFSANSTWR
tara:strand:- start:274 stop:393 length:120 start_codon:yes stop_codon:yes gene_type:complete